MSQQNFRPWLCAVVALAILSGCGQARKTVEGGGVAAAIETKVMSEHTGREASAVERQLSYTHSVAIAVPSDSLKAAYQAVLDACLAAPNAACIVMASSISTGDYPTAEFKLRVNRDAVASMRKQVASLGKVERQSTDAEDLGGPLVDTTGRLAMKKALRDDLLALRARSRTEIEPLLKVTEKLAEVQADIESAEGELAGLRARLATDRLNISLLQSDQHGGVYSVGRALASFGVDIGRGMAALVTFVALALPWFVLLVAVPFVWRGLRRLWRLGRQRS